MQTRKRGIYRGWWVVAAVFLAATLTVGTGQYAFGLFAEPLETAFGWNRTQINASLSFTAVGSLLAPFIGRIMDKHGAKPIMAVSIVLIGISYILRPMMTELWHWYALSLIQFSGYAGASILPTGRLVGIWFGRTRGRVMGFAAMGNNFGGVVVPPFTGVLLSMASWQGAYIGYTIFAAFVLIFAMLAIKEYPSSADLGIEGGDPKDDKPPVLDGWTLQEALHNRAFYFITTAILLGTFTYSTVLPQITAHLTNEGVSITQASIALSLLAACGMLGKLTLGYLSEKITARYTLMIDLTGQATFLILMLFAGTSPLILWIGVPLFGYFLGAFGALFQLIIQDSFGVRNFGSIMGIVNLTSVVSFGLGPLMAGASFDLTGRYHTAFFIVAALFLLGALLLTQANVKERPNVASQPSPAD